jgi:hypothetical protein
LKTNTVLRVLSAYYLFAFFLALCIVAKARYLDDAVFD